MRQIKFGSGSCLDLAHRSCKAWLLPTVTVEWTWGLGWSVEVAWGPWFAWMGWYYDRWAGLAPPFDDCEEG